MKYINFFTELTALGQSFSAPQPDFARYDAYDTTEFTGTQLDVTGYNPQGIIHRMNEVVTLLEKNTPTSPDKWATAKAAAKRKFDVYPSAYANLWAAKKYKSMGGGWKKGKK